MNRDDLQGYLTSDNVQAFLRVIREGESNQNEDAYQMMFGGDHFESFSDHPRQVHVRGALKSTAAGAYQFLVATWDALVKQFGFPDFSPQSQDQAAVALIAGRGALYDVIAGRLDEAISKCNKEWASLPDSPYGQPTRTRKQAREVFEAYGGRVGSAPEASPVPDAPAPVPIATPSVVPKAKVKPMGVFAALLPSLLQMLPQLIPVLGSGSDSEVAKRNQAAGMIVADTLIKATDAVNIQEAHDKMMADPAMIAAASEALSEILPQLLDVGGGVESARKFAAEHETGRYGRIVEVVTYAALFFLLFANVVSFAFAWRANDFAVMADIKQADIGVALIAFGYWLGTSISSKRKDEIGGRQ